MALGRPRRPDDPSIMASVEAAVSTVARPGLVGGLWPYLGRSQADDGDPEEPALYSGPGRLWPFV